METHGKAVADVHGRIRSYATRRGNACAPRTYSQAARVHRGLRNSTPTRNSRSSWQFNFQMRRPDQTCHGVHSTDAGFSRAHNSRLKCEFPRCRCTISVQPLRRHLRRSELRIIPAGNASSTENIYLSASVALTKQSKLQIHSQRISRVEQCLVHRSGRAGSLIATGNKITVRLETMQGQFWGY